jgi:hypothetical protein
MKSKHFSKKTELSHSLFTAEEISPLLFLRRGAGVRSFPELITMPSPKYFYLNFITPPFRGCVKINNETGTKKRERGLNL